MPNWVDSSSLNTAGRIVRFKREFALSTQPTRALLHFSADTRYKLLVNGERVAVGPTRGSPWIWYYDTLDIAPYLREGANIIQFDVVRYFAAVRGAMPFQRTALPGLTVIGRIESGNEVVEVNTANSEWEAQIDESIQFPMGLVDDPFLHVCLTHI